MLSVAKKQRRGFTLIELLVVMAILAILITAVVVNLNSARAKARDSRRVSDLKSIQTALELYNDNNKAYPTVANTYARSECNISYGTKNLAANSVIPGLVPTYLDNFPTDPIMNKAGAQYCYVYLINTTNFPADGKDYALLEDGGHQNVSEIDYASQPLLIDPSRDSGTKNWGTDCVVDGNDIYGWKVSSPGGKCW